MQTSRREEPGLRFRSRKMVDRNIEREKNECGATNTVPVQFFFTVRQAKGAASVGIFHFLACRFEHLETIDGLMGGRSWLVGPLIVVVPCSDVGPLHNHLHRPVNIHIIRAEEASTYHEKDDLSTVVVVLDPSYRKARRYRLQPFWGWNKKAERGLRRWRKELL